MRVAAKGVVRISPTPINEMSRRKAKEAEEKWAGTRNTILTYLLNKYIMGSLSERWTNIPCCLKDD